MECIQRRLNYSPVTAPPGAKVCGVDGCQRKYDARGYCTVHYKNLMRYGTPISPLVALEERNRIALSWINDHIRWTGDDCLMWPFRLNTQNRAVVSVLGKQSYVSRIMCLLAHGDPKCQTLLACHSCGEGDRGCVNPQHLYWGTVKDNADDRRAFGAHMIGHWSHAAKLHDNDVAEIRRLSGKMTQERLAERYGVSKTYIGKIIQGKARAAPSPRSMRMPTFSRNPDAALRTHKG